MGVKVRVLVFVAVGVKVRVPVFVGVEVFGGVGVSVGAGAGVEGLEDFLQETWVERAIKTTRTDNRYPRMKTSDDRMGELNQNVNPLILRRSP